MGVITVDTRDRKPIYEQLTENIRRLVLQGVLQPHEQLPSVRALAVELAINPNTIQKAYRLLEEEGILVSFAGSKSLLQFDEELLDKYRKELLTAEAKKYIEEVKKMGLTEEEALGLIKEIW
jgi:GntR family transcriptional regulator